MVLDSSSEISGFESCAGCCGVDITHTCTMQWCLTGLSKLVLKCLWLHISKIPIGVGKSWGMSPSSGFCVSPIGP